MKGLRTFWIAIKFSTFLRVQFLKQFSNFVPIWKTILKLNKRKPLKQGHEKSTANLQALLMSFLWICYQTNIRDENKNWRATVTLLNLLTICERWTMKNEVHTGKDLSIFGNFFVKYKLETTLMIIQPCVLEENQTCIKNVLNEIFKRFEKPVWSEIYEIVVYKHTETI